MKIQHIVTSSALAFCLAISAHAWPQNQGIERVPLIDQGFHDMYNLHFGQAHALFAKYMAEHPEDPMGPVSDAAAYLFSEFHRTGVLDVQLFTNDTSYLRHKTVPDPAIKKAFDADLDKTNQLADLVLKKNPKDARALFAKTLAY